MKAILLRDERLSYPDDSFAEIVIWELPKPTLQRPHGYKYRLNYCTGKGELLIRYDNEIGKSDHKHIYEMETPYKFETVEKLLTDFVEEIELVRRWMWKKIEE